MATSGAAAGAYGAPPPGLRMVNSMQDNMPNPFGNWMRSADSGPGWDRVARCAAAVPVGIALLSYLYVMF